MRGHFKKGIIITIVLLLSTLTAVADDFTLKGKIIDEDGRALELVTVSCAAQGKITMSNLPLLPEGNNK